MQSDRRKAGNAQPGHKSWQKRRKEMTGEIRTTSVEGKEYTVWSDFIKKCTYAMDNTGNKKAIRTSGYMHNELAVRKAIAIVFHHKTFKK